MAVSSLKRSGLHVQLLTTSLTRTDFSEHVDLVQRALLALGYRDATFGLRPLAQIRWRSHAALSVTRIENHQLMLKVKTGDQTTAFQCRLEVPPQIDLVVLNRDLDRLAKWDGDQRTIGKHLTNDYTPLPSVAVFEPAEEEETVEEPVAVAAAPIVEPPKIEPPKGVADKVRALQQRAEEYSHGLDRAKELRAKVAELLAEAERLEAEAKQHEAKHADDVEGRRAYEALVALEQLLS